MSHAISWLLCPPPILERVIYYVVRFRSATLKGRDAARFVLSLDKRLYGLHGRASIAYGNGVHTKHRHTRYHDFFVERIDMDERVLDVGCGMGALAYDIAERSGACVLGIDINGTALEQARSQFAHERVRYREGDATVDLPIEPFDTVVLSNVLEHIADRPGFLHSIGRRTGIKRYLIRVPVYERDWRVPLKEELGIDYRLDETHEIEYTLESFADEMSAAGLGIVHLECRWGEIWSELHPLVGNARHSGMSG